MKNTKHIAGFTLIEIMISLVIVSFIMLGVFRVFQQQTSVSVTTEDETDMQASTQGAAYMIRNSLVMAGFGRSGQNSFDFVDSPAGDDLTIRMAAQDGNSIITFLLTTQPIVTGSQFTLHCKGVDNTGVKADPARDPILVPNTKMFLLFKSAFDGKVLTGIGTNPVEVATDSGPDCVDHPIAATDLNQDGLTDKVVIVDTVVALTSVPKGATVYAYRVPASGAPALCGGAVPEPCMRYNLDAGRRLLLQNGLPILYGVEDFQVRFQTKDGGWHNDLAGVAQNEIVQVGVGLVVRADRRHDREDGATQITTFNHTYNIPVTEQVFNRKQNIFYVRTRNNAF